MPSTSTFRIPKAEVTGLYGAMMKWFARTKLGGEFPDNGYVYFHHKPLLKAVMSFEAKVDKWDGLDPNLKSYAQLVSAGVIGCCWCLDFGYFKAHNDGLDLAKVVRCRGGASPTCSRRWSATCSSTPRRCPSLR